jgi:hypothetical protein
MSAPVQRTAPIIPPSDEDAHDAILLARLQGDIDDLGRVTEAIMSLQDTDKHYCQHLETLGLGDDLSHLKWRHFTIMSVLAGDCVRLQNRINNDLTDMVKESPRLENAKAHLEQVCSTAKNI